jgi:signal transduction histidine kinase
MMLKMRRPRPILRDILFPSRTRTERDGFGRPEGDGASMRSRIVHEIASAVADAGGVDNVLKALVESIAKGAGASGCTFLTLSAGDDRLEHRISYGTGEHFLRGGQLLEDKALDHVLKGNSLLIWDAGSDPRVLCREEIKARGVASMVFLPLNDSRGTRGVMQLYFSEKKKFLREDLDFLEILAELGGFLLERAETQEQLARDAAAARRDLNLMRDERRRFASFLSMVAHDLKSPLVAVQGYLKLLLRKSADRLDERMVNGIRRSVQRLDSMMELVSDLLELTRLESEQVLHEFKPVSWEEVLGAAVEMAHELAEPRGVTVATEIRRPLPEVFASEIRLQQMILNLVSNSVRFTPRGGTITIRAFVEGEEIIISVEDEGSGIEPQHLPHVFEEFYKGDPDSPEGTGLGLSICKRIADMHNGSIRAESPVPETGKGTRVTFSMPVGMAIGLDSRPEEGESESRRTSSRN